MRSSVRFFVITSLLSSAPALGASVDGTIPLAPHGDGFHRRAGAPLQLTDTSFLLGTLGPDATENTADDAVLLVEGIGGTPTLTPLAVPNLREFGFAARVSPTRALYASMGPDAIPSTADDLVFLLDDLGGANTVTAIPVPFIEDFEFSRPAVMNAETVALSSVGPDGIRSSADDLVYLLSDVGGSNTALALPVPFLGRVREAAPTRITPDSFVQVGWGPDANAGTADDQLYRVSGVNGALAREEIPIAFLGEGRPGRPVRVSATRIAMVGFGPDGSSESADDELVLVDDLGGANTVTRVPIPELFNWGAGLALLGDVATIPSEGPDGIHPTIDDRVVVISDLFGANTQTPLTVPGIMYSGARVKPIGSGRGVVQATGPDLVENTLDDQVVVLSDAGGTNTLAAVPLPGVGYGSAHFPVAVDSESFLVATGGPDGDINAGGDSILAHVTEASGVPMVEPLPIGGDFFDCYSTSRAPLVLGGGRAVALAGGADAVGTGGDDVIVMISGLSEARGLRVDKLKIKADPAKPEKGEKGSFKALLTLDGFPDFGSSDLMITVGPVSQVLPASAFSVTPKGVSYKDKAGEFGPIQKLKYKPAKGKLSVKLRGTGSGLEGANASFLPVALEWDAQYYVQAIAGTDTGKGVSFKR